MKQTKCKYCGAPIVLIKTDPNKTTVCDAAEAVYWASSSGGETIILPNGEMIAGKLDGDPAAATGMGYTLHKPHCGQRRQA